MKICIKNCTLISMEQEREKIEYNIDILVNENKITKIAKNIQVNEEYKIIDGTNKVVMPGLINTHTHIPMSIFRETLDGYDLQHWLSEKIWPMEDKLTDEDVYYASYLSFLEMIKTGTTTANDLYFITDSIIKANKEIGIRLQTGRSLMDNDTEENGIKRFKEQIDLINKYKDTDELLTLNIGIHGLYTNSPKYLDKCIELAKDNKLPIHMHFCENSKEITDIKELYNKYPVQILKEKFKDYKLILAHCVKLSENDINQIKDMNISVSHCPISNLKLGCGIAQINYMLKNNINISLGTDGQGSGSNLDLFETMKLTALLQKGTEEDPTCLPAYEVLKMATINGAKALGMENKIGSIKEGKLADIIIIDINDIKAKPTNDLISQLVYNIKGNNVITTIVNGKILMENKKLINNNEQYIYNKCEEIIKRISI